MDTDPSELVTVCRTVAVVYWTSGSSLGFRSMTVTPFSSENTGKRSSLSWNCNHDCMYVEVENINWGEVPCKCESPRLAPIYFFHLVAVDDDLPQRVRPRNPLFLVLPPRVHPNVGPRHTPRPPRGHGALFSPTGFSPPGRILQH